MNAGSRESSSDEKSTGYIEYYYFYLENYVKPNISDTTYDSYERLTKNHVIPKLGSKSLKKLTTSDIQVLYRELGESGSQAKRRDEETGEMVLTGGGLSAASITRIHNIINPALRQAKNEGKIEKNPAESARKPKVEKKEMEVLTCEEIATFFQAVIGYRYYPAYYFALLSGVRRGEVLGLPWAFVDIGVSPGTL